MAGGVAGMLNWTAMLPIDTLKNKLQVRRLGVTSWLSRETASDMAWCLSR